MRKIFFVAALAFAGLNFVACGSDDSSAPTTDNPNPQPENALIGTWKATNLSYSFTIPGQDEQKHEFAFDDVRLKQGCATDYLTIAKEATASLKENNKNEAGACVDVVHPATWTDTTVTVHGETKARQVVSVSKTELVLKYEMTFNNRSTDVNVKYVKQ